MEILDLIVSTILPIIDIILVAVMLYWVYKLIRGTSAIIIFRGFVIIYIIWWITDIANMNILSNILGGFISVGVFVLITIPSAAGIAQEAIGLGDFSISTKHILQLPAIDSFS